MQPRAHASSRTGMRAPGVPKRTLCKLLHVAHIVSSRTGELCMEGERVAILSCAIESGESQQVKPSRDSVELRRIASSQVAGAARSSDEGRGGESPLGAGEQVRRAGRAGRRERGGVGQQVVEGRVGDGRAQVMAPRAKHTRRGGHCHTEMGYCGSGREWQADTPTRASA